jgi:hypothetical protein
MVSHVSLPMTNACLCVTLVMITYANRKHFNIQWENRSWNNQMCIDCHKPVLIFFYQCTNRTLGSTILRFSCTQTWLDFYFIFYSPLNFFVAFEVVLGFTLCWFGKHGNLRFVPLFRFRVYFIIRCGVTALDLSMPMSGEEFSSGMYIWRNTHLFWWFWLTIHMKFVYI